jgi:hypothetical protein
VAETILSFEVRTTKYGGTRGRFAVHLDRGEVIRVSASGGLAPGERVRIRGVQWGGVIEGVLVAMDRCFAR